MAAWPDGAERKLATVLFADLVGSTALGEGDPERTRALLERFYDAMSAEVERAGGTVEKFVGDAVMAVFGAPAAQEDHAERALHAALSMQRALGQLFGGELALRIGVNTGEVVVGRPREGSSFVTGDAVNVAKRLEEAAAPGEILAGERTASAVRGAFELGKQRALEAKGKSDAVPARPVVRALSLMRPRGVGVLGEAFVGRDTELTLLQTTYRRTVERCEPHLVTVMGDAGVGKTRLLRELWAWLADQEPQPLQRTGRSLPYGRMTYWALAEVLWEHVGLPAGESAEAARERLEGHEALLPTLGLGAGGLHPLAAQEQLHAAWVDFLSALADERPTVVLVEELHWAEEPLLALLERLLRDVRGPLLLLATSRPELLERRPTWGGGRRNASLVWLDPLGRDEAARLVDELVGAELPALRDAVVDRAEGNPFVVEEVLSALIDRGALQRVGGRWEAAAAGEEFTVPDSVHALLAARIDLLPAREKAALQAAAVIGRVFWDGAIRELIGEAPDWALLEDRDFVRRRGSSAFPGDVERAIKHAYTREVAYATLPKARRARLHAAFARWLEGHAEGREQRAAFLAHHYAEAVRPEDADIAWVDDAGELETLRGAAVEWSLVAGRRAAAVYELDEARSLLERAVSLTQPGEGRAIVLREIARTHALAFAGEEFWTVTQQAIDEAESAQLRADLYADLAFETAMRSGIWPRMPEQALVDGWIDEALAGSGPEGVSRAKALIAQARWRPGEGEDTAVVATELAERIGDATLRSAAWDARGIVAFVAGRYEEGRSWAERRFELLDRISDPDARADVHSAPITGCIWSGNFDEARGLAQAHDEIATALTPHHRVHAVAVDLEVEELLGGWEQIRSLQERTEESVAGNASTPCVRNPRSLLVSALACHHDGDLAEAARLEERALEQWMHGYGFTLETPRLRLALARGELGEVERLLETADTQHGWHRGWFVFANVTAQLDAFAELGRRTEVQELAAPYLGQWSYLQPFAQRAMGRVREDESSIRAALEGFEALGLAWHAAETRLVLEP